MVAAEGFGWGMYLRCVLYFRTREGGHEMMKKVITAESNPDAYFYIRLHTGGHMNAYIYAYICVCSYSLHEISYILCPKIDLSFGSPTIRYAVELGKREGRACLLWLVCSHSVPGSAVRMESGGRNRHSFRTVHE